MTVEAVIFDIGNVLIEWQPERYYDRVVGEARRREMFASVDLHGMNDEVDRGGDFTATIYAAAEKYPEFRGEIRQWHDNWIELASPEIPRSIRLLRALRAKGVPVFALSNFGIGSFAYAETKYPFLAEFDRRYISGHMQVIKPDPRIYEMVEEDCGIAPSALLFADDRADNIAAAAARGWQVHQFTGPEGWAETLVAKGLLSAEEAA
ncbi:HAD-IA family hydrolase [Mangrovicoccus sp. HB161399]|uniref:HAD-IA family hydrolase n=1 Tax=Mangrovicoccus sp. HB161399 TaxID=2720392 RepID=UPI001554F27D|nr:HAD-IA family hydrolase [Mangrovicoccus sp. HB161399]